MRGSGSGCARVAVVRPPEMLGLQVTDAVTEPPTCYQERRLDREPVKTNSKPIWKEHSSET